MKTLLSVLRPSAIVVIILALLVGCERVQPIYNVQNRLVPATLGSLGLDEIEKRIIDAAEATQWLATPVRPGVLRATNRWRQHEAVVKIEFNTKTYSIQYESSFNLLHRIGFPETSYAGQKVIHRNYNRRVRQLELEIERRLYRRAS